MTNTKNKRKKEYYILEAFEDMKMIQVDKVPAEILEANHDKRFVAIPKNTELYKLYRRYFTGRPAGEDCENVYYAIGWGYDFVTYDMTGKRPQKFAEDITEDNWILDFYNLFYHRFEDPDIFNLIDECIDLPDRIEEAYENVVGEEYGGDYLDINMIIDLYEYGGVYKIDTNSVVALAKLADDFDFHDYNMTTMTVANEVYYFLPGINKNHKYLAGGYHELLKELDRRYMDLFN